MPLAPLRPCRNNRCATLVQSGYCDDCKPLISKAPATRSRPEGSQTFYNSVHWQKIRRLIRQRDPICKVCRRKPSESVDHIDGDWRNNDDVNLQGICNACHHTKSAKQHNERKVRA